MAEHVAWLNHVQRAQALLIGLVLLLWLITLLHVVPAPWVGVVHVLLVVCFWLLVASTVLRAGAWAWGIWRRRVGRVRA